MKKVVLLLGFLATLIIYLNSVSSADCTPNWQCSEWSNCIDNAQIRNCYDVNLCGNAQDKPIERQTCGTPCTPNWQCNEWDPSGCNETQLQKRTCIDTNNCNILNGKPEEAKSCEFVTDHSWIFYLIVAIIIILIMGAIWLLIKKAR